MIYTTVIYGTTFLISLLFCKIYEKKQETLSIIKKILLIIGILIPPILLATLRYGVGYDYYDYIRSYSMLPKPISINGIIINYSKEPLFFAISSLAYLLSGNFVGMFWLHSIVFIFFIFEGIRYYEDKISITLALLIFYLTYYLVFFNPFRQMIAVAIILFASRYLFEKKFWKYLFWVIVAGLYHKTAYVMIFLYLLTFKLDSKKISRFFYLMVFISPLFIYPFLKLVVYINRKLVIFGAYSVFDVNFNISFLLYILPVLLFIWFYRKKLLQSDIRNEIFIRIVFLQIPAQFAGCFIEYSDRMALYFGIFQIILISAIVKLPTDIKFDIKFPTIKNNLFFYKIINFIYRILNNKKCQLFIIISWYVFYYFVLYILMNSNGVYPYKTIFEMNEFPIDKVLRKG